MSDNDKVSAKKDLVQNQSEDLENADAEELFETLEGVPEEKRKVIEQLMISSVQMSGRFSPENAISKKITEEHISQYLEGAREDMQKSYDEKKQKKIFMFFMLLLTMVFFVVVILILKDKPEIMEKVIYTLGGLVAGAFGGYGFGKRRNED